MDDSGSGISEIGDVTTRAASLRDKIRPCAVSSEELCPGTVAFKAARTFGSSLINLSRESPLLGEEVDLTTLEGDLRDTEVS